MGHGPGVAGRRVIGAVALVAPVVIGTSLVLTSHWRERWSFDPWDRPVLAANLLAMAVCCWGGWTMQRRRPANACGPLAIALGISIGVWYLPWALNLNSGWWPFFGRTAGAPLRLLVFWLVLAWPTGRLDRISRWLLTAYVAQWAVFFLVDSMGQSPSDWPHDPIAVWGPSAFTRLWFSAWWVVGGLFMAIAVLVVAWRRRLRFRGSPVSSLARPGWWAAAISAGAYLIVFFSLPLADLTMHADKLTALGATIQVVDLVGWAGAAVIVAVSARWFWTSEADEGEVELGDSAGFEVARVLGMALRDPTVQVAVQLEDGRWVDAHTGLRAGTSGGDRAVTLVARDGEPIARIEHDPALALHPSALEGAATAVGLRLDALHQAAIAEARRTDLCRLGRELLDGEDSARARLEHDLHDGTQQTLVGLALEASLMARRASQRPEEAAVLAEELAMAVDGARDELALMGEGRPPALLAERGLTGALGALAATAGMPVDVQLDACSELPDRLQRAVWFSAAEAMANALKHARATRISLRLTRTAEGLQLEVGDNGVGGVAAPPRALARRVEAAGGMLTVTSAPSVGTAVRATFPLALAAVTA